MTTRLTGGWSSIRGISLRTYFMNYPKRRVEKVEVILLCLLVLLLITPILHGLIKVLLYGAVGLVLMSMIMWYGVIVF
jgi:hypothetical protein